MCLQQSDSGRGISIGRQVTLKKKSDAKFSSCDRVTRLPANCIWSFVTRLAILAFELIGLIERVFRNL